MSSDVNEFSWTLLEKKNPESLAGLRGFGLCQISLDLKLVEAAGVEPACSFVSIRYCIFFRVAEQPLNNIYYCKIK